MDAVFHDDQRRHAPQAFLVNGVKRPNPETEARVNALLASLGEGGHAIVDPPDYGEATIAAVHSPDYVRFLRTAHARWSTRGEAGDVMPSVHPARRGGRHPEDLTAQAGYYLADMACPVAAQTWRAARACADTVAHAVELVRRGAPAAYALCRPGGHHADPSRFYPFFWGYRNERGLDAGRGYNLNLPLARGSEDADYLPALDLALEQVRNFGPEALVLSLGLDGHAGAPLGGFRLTTAGYAHAATRIGALALPTVIVQEGGYIHAAFGATLQAFLDGFETARGKAL